MVNSSPKIDLSGCPAACVSLHKRQRASPLIIHCNCCFNYLFVQLTEYGEATERKDFSSLNGVEEELAQNWW